MRATVYLVALLRSRRRFVRASHAPAMRGEGLPRTGSIEAMLAHRRSRRPRRHRRSSRASEPSRRSSRASERSRRSSRARELSRDEALARGSSRASGIACMMNASRTAGATSESAGKREAPAAAPKRDGSQCSAARRGAGAQRPRGAGVTFERARKSGLRPRARQLERRARRVHLRPSCARAVEPSSFLSRPSSSS
jgi:hypothetical protein